MLWMTINKDKHRATDGIIKNFIKVTSPKEIVQPIRAPSRRANVPRNKQK